MAVNVVDYVALEGISAANETKDLFFGESFNVGVKFTPENTTRKAVTCTSSDENVATVDHLGNVTATGRGNATITATSSEGFTATTTVNVYNKTTLVDLKEETIVVNLENETEALPLLSLENDEDAVLQWKSTDNAVAEVADGVIQLKKAGTTSIVVTEERTGLSDSLIMFVTDADTPVFSEIVVGNSNNIYGLDQNGNMYYLYKAEKADFIIPTKLPYQDVKKHNGSTYIKTNGEIYIADDLLTDFFTDKNPVDVIYESGSYFVLTESGDVYSWGNNSNGRLGLGHTDAVATPTKIDISNVVAIGSSSYNSEQYKLLKENGNLYVTAIQNENKTSPSLIAENVLCLSDDSLSKYVQKNTITDIYYSTVHSFEADLSKYDKVLSSGYNAYGIKDGKLYLITY